MKAFPHQISDLDKLTSALRVISLLRGQGKNPHNDGEYGSELAMTGVYSFRNLNTSIPDRLDLERKKPSGDQGFRTAARDLRRFFMLCDLIDGNCELTIRGAEIVANSVQKPLRDALWREAMLDLRLGDADNSVSHPYRVLLKLIAHHPGIETRKLYLAFEAIDDSLEEFERVLSLSNLEFQKSLDETGTSSASAANAVKILPSIAEQVGDIKRGRESYITNTSTATEDGVEAASPAETIKKTLKPSTEVSPEDIAKIPSFGDAPDSSTFDLAAANAIRKKRTIKHQQAVVSFAKVISASGFKVFENPFDCLGFKSGTGSILAEIKTLDGTAKDERRQSIKALGQIKSYSYFNVENAMKAPRIVETVAYDQTPNPSTISFMKENEVKSIWLNEDQWFTADASGVTAIFSADSFVTS